MRVLIDTCIFIYIISDDTMLSADVSAILGDYDTELCMSMESVKELIVAFRNKGFDVKEWKTAEDLIHSIQDEYFITILPVGFETMATYARLRINEAEGHHDPSDHVIISQALTEHLPLITSDHKFKFYKKQGLDLIYNE